MPPKRLRKLNGNVLKLIAVITMLIDHIGAGIIYPAYNEELLPGGVFYDNIQIIYRIIRSIGRTAFPLFCFLLVEGFVHTKSRLRYALSLLVFAIISEVPYDLLINCRENEFSLNIISVLKQNSCYLGLSCNVMFTLLIGLIVLAASESVSKSAEHFALPVSAKYLVSLIPIGVGIFLANFIKCDYKGYGVALIAILYLLRDMDFVAPLVGYAMFATYSTEAYSLPAFILMLFYSKKRGRRLGRLKYLFYAIYPIHLLFYYALRCLLFM